MTRSQRSHNLLGKLDLLPLKAVFMVKPKVHGQGCCHALQDWEKDDGLIQQHIPRP